MIHYPEKHDLALSKLARLLGNDLDDIVFLHENFILDYKTFSERYVKEFRPLYVGDRKRLDLNFLDAVEELWGAGKRNLFLQSN